MLIFFVGGVTKRSGLCHLLLINKLTKGQKDYKRRKEQGLKDARLVEREDGKKVPRITKRQLCVRVSQEASERLSVEAEKRKLTKQEKPKKRWTWKFLRATHLPSWRGLGTSRIVLMHARPT